MPSQSFCIFPSLNFSSFSLLKPPSANSLFEWFPSTFERRPDNFYSRYEKVKNENKQPLLVLEEKETSMRLYAPQKH